VIGMTDAVSGVGISPDSYHHISLFSFRIPQCVSSQSGLNTRSTRRPGISLRPRGLSIIKRSD
jgi:hypothetical protein